ncbi:transcriptional regulator, XRE family [Methylobacterium nodulans ORS 2060]|uniref:Transcriptional regulator, XRE family n=1 Tax=Methylobacterium nodulans (strain LMG 21967 / CNCM I-2342 / ORS 2060) TaxID=460265 RepID=B8ICQ8_METNO|nr:transcriptional regulator, XRE family [Methylobacterium nodulans ORS 2060]
MLREWIAGQLRDRRIPQKALSSAIGLSEDAVSRMLSGKRTIKADELKRICAFLGVSPPLTAQLPARDVSYVKVVGEVAAGAFVDMQYVDFVDYDIPYVADPRWPKEAITAYIVRGESINRQARDGDHIIVLDANAAPRPYQLGDWVVVEQRCGDLVETTVKQVRGSEGAWELWPDSNDGRFQRPLVVAGDGGDNVRVIGFVLDFIRSGTRF